MKPILYGIGVGPGDPELLTIKAINTLKRTRVIFAPKATAEHSSLAGKIISPYLTAEHKIIELVMPMTADAQQLKDAWQKNAKLVASYMNENNPISFVTLGDISLYSTFHYLVHELTSILPELVIEIVPGITSFAAASARISWSLADRDNPLLILPVSKSIDLEDFLRNHNRIVLMKVGNYLDNVRSTITRTGPWQGKIISYCGQEKEQILDLDVLEKVSSLPYMTVILLAKE